MTANMKWYRHFMRRAAMYRYFMKHGVDAELTSISRREMLGNLRQAIMWKWEPADEWGGSE